VGVVSGVVVFGVVAFPVFPIILSLSKGRLSPDGRGGVANFESDKNPLIA
jgi:hypothetical protein